VASSIAPYQGEIGATALKPVMAAAVDLQKLSFPGIALSAAAVFRGPSLSGAPEPCLKQYAAYRRP
jgi:hypothetical protein